jgi:VWFA-related protein
MRSFSVCVAAGLALAAAVLSARQEPAQDRPVFRSGIDLVRLDIRVIDSQGRPIPDLRPEEVQIVDAGEHRPVLLFQHIAESGRSYAESAQRTIAAEVSTNQGSPRGQLYVLMFDQQHITAGTELKVRQAAERFLRGHLRPQDRVAIYGLPLPGPALGFTSNVRVAVEQLQHVRGGLERMVTSAVGDMTLSEAYQIARGNEGVIEGFMTPSSQDGASTRMSSFADMIASAGKKGAGVTPAELQDMIVTNAKIIANQADADSRAFLRLAANTIRGLSGADGRKTIVLFTEGFYGDNLTREVQDVAAAAAETYSVVYAFDLNSRVENVSGEVSSTNPASDANDRLEPIGNLAAETNGALVIDALSHLDQALNELGDANADYYIVGFAASADAARNRESYERVSVRVTRPGATVSTRTGYATGPAPTAADRRKAIDAALAAPFSQQGLRVEYTTYVSQADIPSRDRVVVSLEAELPVAKTEASDPADVVFVVRDSRTGQVEASGSDHIALPTASAPGLSTGRGAWRVQFTLTPGDYLMRCVVREPGGLLGSADRQFSARALGSAEIAASDLVLRSPDGSLPVRATGYTREPLAGAVRVYGRAADQLADLSARLELVSLDELTQTSSESPTIAVNAALGETKDTGAQAQRDVMFSVPLDRVEPGEYVARAIVQAHGEVIADLLRQVHVLDGAAPAGSAATAATQPRDVVTGSIAQRLIATLRERVDAPLHRAVEMAQASRWSDVLAAIGDAPATDLGAQQLRGLALMALGRYDAAAAQFSAVFVAQPDSAAVAFVLGWAEVGIGDDRAAIGAFRNAVLRDPSMVPAHLALAEAFLRLNQPGLAAQALEAGLSAVPDAVELKVLLEKIRGRL